MKIIIKYLYTGYHGAQYPPSPARNLTRFLNNSSVFKVYLFLGYAVAERHLFAQVSGQLLPGQRALVQSGFDMQTHRVRCGIFVRVCLGDIDGHGDQQGSEGYIASDFPHITGKQDSNILNIYVVVLV